MNAFLENLGWGTATVQDLAGDASARSYKRLTRDCSAGKTETAILMIDPDGDTATFFRIARYLVGLGLSAPQIYAKDDNLGLMLIEDLGDALVAKSATSPQQETEMYCAAADVLIALRNAPPAPDLPKATPAYLAQLIEPAFEFYLSGHDIEDSRKTRLIDLFETLLTKFAPETDVTVLRDYHAENILWLPNRDGVARAGVLDFQDAWQGHPAYDLVSLLQDARRDVSQATQDAVLAHYIEQTGCDGDALERSMAILGAQRHLRILGIFARLSARSGKKHYVDFIPRTYRQLQSCLAHPELADLQSDLADILPYPDHTHLDRLRT